MNKEKFRDKVKFYLNKAGQSQDKLANSLGLSLYTLNHKLAGRKKLTVAEIKLIVKYLLELEAITQQSELEEFLSFYDLSLNDLGSFELKSAEFARLEKKEQIYERWNLPAQVNTFIGRDQEVKSIRNSLLQEDIRLVTLTGTGGIGKTRLALRIAETLLNEFPDGVFFVPLASLTESALVGSEIRKAIGLEEQKGKAVETTLKEWLRNKKLLLVIDNFEHLLDSTNLLMELLSAAPFLKILVTSRARLRAYGEFDFAVTLLPLPDLERLPENIEVISGYSGIKLFIDRAQAANSKFIFNSQNAAIVADICNRLDGLPLAIELAASRLKVFSLEALQKQLSLKLLTVLSRTLPERHKSLQQAITWSFDLLTEAEKTLFVRLSIFSGSFSVDGASKICNPDNEVTADILKDLSTLVDFSFLQPVLSDKFEDEPRFTMLETLREYALENLKISQDFALLQISYTNFYLSLANKAGEELLGSSQDNWLYQLEVELDNLRTAIELNLANGKTEETLKTVSSIWRFWWLHGHLKEGRFWLDKAINAVTLSEEKVDNNILALSNNVAGILSWAQGNYFEAITFYEEGLKLSRIADNKSLTAKILVNIGVISIDQADYEKAKQNFIEGLELGRLVSDKKTIYLALGNLGLLAIDNDIDNALIYFEESLQISTELGDKWGTATTYGNLGELYFTVENYPKANSYQKKCLELHQELGDKRGIAMALDNLGKINQTLGDYSFSLKLYKQAAVIWKQFGVNPNIACCLAGIGNVLVDLDKLEMAIQTYGAVEAFCEFLRTPLPKSDRTRYEHYIEIARQHMNEFDFNKNWSKGLLLTTSEALDFALKI